MGLMNTDFFFSTFKNDSSLLYSKLNLYRIFREKLNISLIPEWPVARVPLSKGEIAPYLKKYKDYLSQTKGKTVQFPPQLPLQVPVQLLQPPVQVPLQFPPQPQYSYRCSFRCKDQSAAKRTGISLGQNYMTVLLRSVPFVCKHVRPPTVYFI